MSEDRRWPKVWAYEGCGAWERGRQVPSTDSDFTEDDPEWADHCRSCHHYSAPGNVLGQCRKNPPVLLSEEDGG